MSIFAWIILGLFLGIILNKFDPKPAYGGIVGAVFLGLTGALLGGMLSLIFIRSGILSSINFYSLIIAFGGSFAVLMIGRSVRKV